MAKISDLTAVILTKNEEENLPRCLRSLQFVGQIFVIDDESTDKTVEIAREAGAQVFSRKLDDFSSQRNFGLKKVKTEWVLMIDADEEVTSGLAREIKKAVKKKEFSGFSFRRKNFIFGRWIRHSGWYPDWQLHLFRTKAGRYVEKVHEQSEVKGKVGQLKNHLLHHNYESISHFLHPDQFDQYANLEAKQLIEGGYNFSPNDLLKKPIDEFLRRFFAEKGYLDGVLGLILALFQAFKELVVYAKIWEKTGSEPTPEFLSSFKKEFSQKKKEVNYWLLTAQISQEKNFFKKLCLKLKRKNLR
jgi:glycosyltransferase involved in cell wall biosynthesis